MDANAPTFLIVGTKPKFLLKGNQMLHKFQSGSEYLLLFQKFAHVLISEQAIQVKSKRVMGSVGQDMMLIEIHL